MNSTLMYNQQLMYEATESYEVPLNLRVKICIHCIRPYNDHCIPKICFIYGIINQIRNDIILKAAL